MDETFGQVAKNIIEKSLAFSLHSESNNEKTVRKAMGIRVK